MRRCTVAEAYGLRLDCIFASLIFFGNETVAFMGHRLFSYGSNASILILSADIEPRSVITVQRRVRNSDCQNVKASLT